MAIHGAPSDFGLANLYNESLPVLPVGWTNARPRPVECTFGKNSPGMKLFHNFVSNIITASVEWSPGVSTCFVDVYVVTEKVPQNNTMIFPFVRIAPKTTPPMNDYVHSRFIYAVETEKYMHILSDTDMRKHFPLSTDVVIRAVLNRNMTFTADGIVVPIIPPRLYEAILMNRTSDFTKKVHEMVHKFYYDPALFSSMFIKRPTLGFWPSLPTINTDLITFMQPLNKDEWFEKVLAGVVALSESGAF